MRIKSKIWLEKDGRLVFGEGKSRILKAIQKYRSINKAASSMGMSYRHAWSYIGEIEKRANIKLIERIKGGRGGGGSRLTDSATELIKNYDKLKEDVDEYTDRKAKEIFSEWRGRRSQDSSHRAKKR